MIKDGKDIWLSIPEAQERSKEHYGNNYYSLWHLRKLCMWSEQGKNNLIARKVSSQSREWLILQSSLDKYMQISQGPHKEHSAHIRILDGKPIEIRSIKEITE